MISPCSSSPKEGNSWRAFRAWWLSRRNRANGYPEDVRGSVLDSRGDTVVSFVAEHDGMGTFLLCPLQGETYRALCRAGEREIRQRCPKSEKEHAP